MDPRGKVALITGAGSGIGRATALALAREGASVVVADMDRAGGADTLGLVEEAGSSAAFIQTDVTIPADIDAMIAFALERYGGLDIMHANAGINTPRPHFPQAPRAAWEKVLSVDLWAVAACIQATVPVMQERGGGVIVSTSSLAGLIGYIPDPIYSAAKHGVVGLTRSLVFLKTEANIRVNCVCPTVVDTPMVSKRNQQVAAAGLPPEASASMPLITAEEVAQGVLEFIHDDSLAGQVMGIVFGRPRRLVPPPVSLV
jgi:NAD(P)-dependent dehydrogenase (short-subunit alcohol dehydrogenase family)